MRQRRYQHYDDHGGRPGCSLSWSQALAITLPLLLMLVFKDTTASAIRAVVPSGGGPPAGAALHAAGAQLHGVGSVAEDGGALAAPPGDGGADGSASAPRLKRTRKQRPDVTPSTSPIPIEEEVEQMLAAAEAGRQKELTPPEGPAAVAVDPPPPPPPAPAPAPAPPPAQPQLLPANDAPAPGGNPRPALNAIAIVAPGTRVFPELMRTLVSISVHAPSAVVLLLVTRTEAEALRPHLALPGEPRSPGKLSLNLRMYNWDYFNDALPAKVRERFPSIKRYSVYPAVLDDMERGGALAAEHPEAVFFTNLAPAQLRLPDGVMLSDGRDVVFQRDPFDEMWARVSARAADAAAAKGAPRSSAPGGGLGWGDGLQAMKYLLAAQEAEVMKLKDEDWNRSWVHYW